MPVGEINAHWKVGNTRPAVLITLNLGTDPQTGAARTLAGTDTVTQIMRNRTTTLAAIVRTLTIVDAASNRVLYSPAAGDLDTAGDYEVEFDITEAGVGGRVETVPDDPAENYWYRVGRKVSA